jgi:hypothetical protein
VKSWNRIFRTSICLIQASFRNFKNSCLHNSRNESATAKLVAIGNSSFVMAILYRDVVERVRIQNQYDNVISLTKRCNNCGRKGNAEVCEI